MIAKWLMETTDFKPVVGQEFMFHTKPIPQVDFDGKVYCKVTEAKPLEKLSYSWKGGNGPMALDTEVHWTLVNKDNGTELTLEHAGFDEMKNAFAIQSMGEGWSNMVPKAMVPLLEKMNK
jgi:uncharacterized protein YndB with AHSA1/START domain